MDLSVPRYVVNVNADNKVIFEMCNYDLVDYVLLLRKVAENPEMTQEGPVLTEAINDYCECMRLKRLNRMKDQVNLPWQIEWIWHIHRLHPLNYQLDCIQGILGGKIVDKLIRKTSLRSYDNVTTKRRKYVLAKPTESSLFVPSIDLEKAAVRQRVFLKNFCNHYLFTCDLTAVTGSYFKNAVQNYVTFIEMANPNGPLILPTFDIHIMWHTHMRFPRRYINDCKILCGFVPNHDDVIGKNVFHTAYGKTTRRCDIPYKSKYDDSINMSQARNTQLPDSCAIGVGLNPVCHNVERRRPNTGIPLVVDYGPRYLENGAYSNKTSKYEYNESGGWDGASFGHPGCGATDFGDGGYSGD